MPWRQALQSSPGILPIGAAIFIVLFTVILTTLRRAEPFPRGANVTLAICASLLAMIGMLRTFGQVGETAKNSGGTWLDFILLPYTAMAIAMLLVLLLLLLDRLVSRKKKALDRTKPRFPDRYAECGGYDEECERPGVIGEREDTRPADWKSASRPFRHERVICGWAVPCDVASSCEKVL